MKKKVPEISEFQNFDPLFGHFDRSYEILDAKIGKNSRISKMVNWKKKFLGSQNSWGLKNSHWESWKSQDSNGNPNGAPMGAQWNGCGFIGVPTGNPIVFR